MHCALQQGNTDKKVYADLTFLLSFMLRDIKAYIFNLPNHNIVEIFGIEPKLGQSGVRE